MPAISNNLNSVDSDWYGYGGVGDYASSHGNTPDVVNTAHRLRDGEFANLPSTMAIDEEYDLVIVGGGMAGLGAAWHFKKNAKPGKNVCCWIIILFLAVKQKKMNLKSLVND